jgi:hypothetical protein
MEYKQKSFDIFDELNQLEEERFVGQNQQHSSPTNPVARIIWNECGFGPYAQKAHILHSLEKWVHTHNVRKEDEIRIQYNGTRYRYTWDSFQSWFLCACPPLI